MSEEKLRQLLLEFEDTLSLVAQQTDKRNTNLQIDLEDYKEEVEALLKKRWHWFLGAVGAAILAFFVLGFEMWERQYDRITKVETGLELLQNTQGRILDKLINRTELEKEMIELRVDIEKERRSQLKELFKELRQEIDRERKRGK